MAFGHTYEGFAAFIRDVDLGYTFGASSWLGARDRVTCKNVGTGISNAACE
jgi:hypothetical protein